MALVGGVLNEIVNMVASSAGLWPESDCSGKDQKQLYSKLQAHPLVREGTPHQETSKSQTGKKCVPDGSLTPWQTGRLTVGRILTSTPFNKHRRVTMEGFRFGKAIKSVLQPGKNRTVGQILTPLKRNSGGSKPPAHRHNAASPGSPMMRRSSWSLPNQRTRAADAHFCLTFQLTSSNGPGLALPDEKRSAD
jgi:hypothetical protein